MQQNSWTPCAPVFLPQGFCIDACQGQWLDIVAFGRSKWIQRDGNLLLEYITNTLLKTMVMTHC